MNDRLPALHTLPETGDDDMSDIVEDVIGRLRLNNDDAIAFNDLQTWGDAPAEPLQAPPPSPINAICRNLQDQHMGYDLIRDISSNQKMPGAVDTVAIKALCHFRHINAKPMSESSRKRRSTVAHVVQMLSEISTCDENKGYEKLHRAKLCCRRHRSGLKKHTTTPFPTNARSEDSRSTPNETSPVEASSRLQRALPGFLPPPLDLPPPVMPASCVSSALMLSDSMDTTDTASQSSGLQPSTPVATTSSVDSSKLVLTSLERRRALAARFQRRAYRRQKRGEIELLSQQMSKVNMGSD